MRRFVSVGVLLCACSSRVELSSGDGSLGGGGGSPHPAVGAVTSGGGELPSGYHEEPCPIAVPIESFACDPWDERSCAAGEACQPYAIYPAERCEEEIYGATCVPAGEGGQGVECWGPSDCLPGFVCAVTGAGDQCVQLCPLVGAHPCPEGLVCEPLDVQGFGGCL